MSLMNDALKRTHEPAEQRILHSLIQEKNHTKEHFIWPLMGVLTISCLSALSYYVFYNYKLEQDKQALQRYQEIEAKQESLQTSFDEKLALQHDLLENKKNELENLTQILQQTQQNLNTLLEEQNNIKETIQTVANEQKKASSPPPPLKARETLKEAEKSIEEGKVEQKVTQINHYERLAENYFEKALEYAANNMTQPAIQAFKQSMDTFPTAHTASEYIKFLLQSEQYRSAGNTAQQFIAQFPESSNLKHLAAHAYLSLNEPTEALTILADLNLNDQESQAIQAKAFIKLKEYSSALAIYTSLKNNDPSNKLWLFGEAYCFEQLQDYQKAIPAYYQIAESLDNNGLNFAAKKRLTALLTRKP